jgi:hypothetical protein
MNCASCDVPSVHVTIACVSPRVKSDEPWTRGSQPTSLASPRISEKRRPSGRRRLWRMSSRKSFSLSESNRF